LLLCGALSCRGKADKGEVIDRYIAAFNAHNPRALRAVVADTAKYISGQTLDGEPLFLHHVQRAWKHPATADSKMTRGQYDGKDVVVVWTRPRLPDGSKGPWTKGAYLELEVGDGKITREYGTLTLYDPDLQKRIIANPPK